MEKFEKYPNNYNSINIMYLYNRNECTPIRIINTNNRQKHIQLLEGHSEIPKILKDNSGNIIVFMKDTRKFDNMPKMLKWRLSYNEFKDNIFITDNGIDFKQFIEVKTS